LLPFLIIILINPLILHHKVGANDSACLNYIWEWNILFITVLCLPCSPRYTAIRIKNCLKSTPVIKVATMKNTMVPCILIIVWNWSIHCSSLSAIFNLLHYSTNQELFEKHLCNQGSHYEKYRDDFRYTKKAIMCNYQINTFHYQQRWMEHKGGHWLVPKECIGRTAVCQKAPLRLKRHQTVKKNQASNLSRYWVMLVWRNQAVS